MKNGVAPAIVIIALLLVTDAPAQLVFRDAVRDQPATQHNGVRRTSYDEPITCSVTFGEPSCGVPCACEPGWGIAGACEPSCGIVGSREPSCGIAVAREPSCGIVGSREPSCGIVDPYEPSCGIAGAFEPSCGIAGSCEPSCGIVDPCEPSCGIIAACEPSCGICEPSCGICEPSCGIVDPCEPSCGIIAACEPSCGIAAGCEPSCGMPMRHEPSCGLPMRHEPSCGIASCGNNNTMCFQDLFRPRCGCGWGQGLVASIGHVLFGSCGGCGDCAVLAGGALKSRRGGRSAGSPRGFAPIARCADFVRTSRALYQPPPPYATLGSISDSIWQQQERSGEAAEFIVYEHEFKLNEDKLNPLGLDHIKQIAYRLQQGQQFPIVVERGMTSPKAGTQFAYPVHFNPQLDNERRDMVVRALKLLRVPNADERVVVGQAYMPGVLATEAIGAYQRAASFGGLGGFGGGGFGGGGFGGGFGGGIGF